MTFLRFLCFVLAVVCFVCLILGRGSFNLFGETWNLAWAAALLVFFVLVLPGGLWPWPRRG